MENKSALKHGRVGMLMVLAGFAFLAVGCGKPEKKPPAAIRPIVTVKPVVKRDIPIQFDFSGTLGSIRDVEIIPRVSGWINEVDFIDGTFVEEGTRLYLIDPKPFQAALDAAKGKLATDRAQYEFWETQAKRYTLLNKEGAVSKEKMQSMQAHAKAFLSMVAEDEANVKQAELNLSYTTVLAPFSGRMQRTLVHKGALVTSQKTVLTKMVVIDPIYVYFNISRSNDYHMQLMARQGKLFPESKMYFSVFLPDGSVYGKTGSLDYISFLIDSTTDCLQARGVIENTVLGDIKGDYGLIPGQYVPVRVTIGEEPDALMILDTAIVQSQLGATVYVVGKDNVVSERGVELGLGHNGMRQITKGLQEGEMVVVKGVQKVKDGIKVDTQKD